MKLGIETRVLATIYYLDIYYLQPVHDPIITPASLLLLTHQDNATEKVEGVKRALIWKCQHV